MSLLGVVTIGQAPRSDVGPILKEHIGAKAEIIQVGVLDGMSKAEISASLAPSKGEYTLTSRLVTGESAVMSKEKIQPILQTKIEELESKGCKQILVLCTGVFEGLTSSRSYLIEPDQIITPTVAAMSKHRRIGVILPLEEQKISLNRKWTRFGLQPFYAIANPYQFEPERFEAAAIQLKEQGADLILLDCMGYVEVMREVVAKASGLPVILSNALMAKIVSEMI